MGKKCYRCGQDRMVKNGVSTNGYQKYRCSYCGHCYTSQTELVNPQLAAFKATTRQAGPMRPLNTAKPASTVDLVLTVLLGWAGQSMQRLTASSSDTCTKAPCKIWRTTSRSAAAR